MGIRLTSLTLALACCFIGWSSAVVVHAEPKELVCRSPASIESVLNECALPAPGEVRIVASEFPVLKHFYKLTRLPDQDGKPHLEITIPIQFEAMDNAPKNMEVRTRRCLKNASSKLLGPNGEQLTLRLGDAEEKTRHRWNPLHFKLGRSGANLFKIHVHSETSDQMRTTVDDFMADVECPVILHEVLHLLGLVDEYAEPDPARGYFARALGPKNSIMSDQVAAWEATERSEEILSSQRFQIEWKTRQEHCNFKPPREVRAVPRSAVLDEFLSYRLDEKDPIRQWPGPRIHRVEYVGRGGPIDSEEEIVTCYDFYRVIDAIQLAPRRNSLLRRGQFNRIVYPKCEAINQVYNRCAANAYLQCRRPTKWTGSVPWDEDSSIPVCPPLPVECQSPIWVDK